MTTVKRAAKSITEPWYKSQLEKDGFKEGTKEYTAERYQRRRKYQEGFSERDRVRKQIEREKDVERARARERESKARRIERVGRPAINEIQRNNYHANRSERLKQIYAARKRRDPARGLHSTIRDFEQGRIGFDELDRRFSEALAYANEGTNEERTRSGRKTARHRAGGDDSDGGA